MTTIPKTPPIELAQIVMVCLGCTHWQCDITPEALTEYDTPDDYITALGAIFHEHRLTRCVNPDGRMQIGGHWFEKPTGPSGRPADAALGGMRLPEWWVWK